MRHDKGQIFERESEKGEEGSEWQLAKAKMLLREMKREKEKVLAYHVLDGGRLRRPLNKLRVSFSVCPANLRPVLRRQSKEHRK